MKLLIISFAGIGDTLLATPLIRRLREKFIAVLRRERYGGGEIPQRELDEALKAVGLWQCNGRAA